MNDVAENLAEGRRLRDMVLTLAAEMARDLVSVVQGSAVQTASRTDEIDGGTMKWQVTVVFFAVSDTVNISGEPMIPPDQAMHPLAQIFRLSQQGADDGSFSFHVPLAWLPTPEIVA